MVKRVLTGLGLLIAGLATVVLARTVQVSDDTAGMQAVPPPDVNEAVAVDRLSRAVRIATVSYQDSARRNLQAFERFIRFMEETYPRVHEHLDRTRVGHHGHTLLYRWQGRDTSRTPGMLMGHYDVVPVAEETTSEWAHPPFGGVQTEGFIWGRGTLDDKSGLLSVFEAVRYLLRQGYRPERTMYIAANHDEEVGGRNGAAQVAELLERRGVTLEFLVDEGLPVAEEIIQDVTSPLAMIGVAEKGSLTLQLEIIRNGGHASMPPQETAIGELSTAIHTLKENPMRGQFGELLQQSFEPVSAELPFVYRMGLSNLWLFRPLIKARLSNFPHTNAALRTTAAPTIFRAGTKVNMLPTHAEAILNFRIHPRDRISSVIDHVESTIDNPAIEIKTRSGAREASFVSDLDAPSYQQLKQSIWETFGQIPVAPSIFVAATDSRHFHNLTRDIYRFRPIRARPSDRNRIHGTNERIDIENYREMIHFQIRLLKNTTS